MFSANARYYLKHKKIRIFKEDNNGNTKKYIHSKDTFLNAYVRQLSANEQSSLNAIQDASNIEFVINYREVVVDMFVEFENKTYQIVGIDRFNFLPIEIKCRAYEVNSKTYENIEWS